MKRLQIPDIVIIGRDEPNEVIGVIRDHSVKDEHGNSLEVSVDYRYAFEHPELYSYLGSGVEWNTKVHYFEYIGE